VARLIRLIGRVHLLLLLFKGPSIDNFDSPILIFIETHGFYVLFVYFDLAVRRVRLRLAQKSGHSRDVDDLADGSVHCVAA
jgi:hypothetical protein